jgi:hypothetical protein
LNCFLESIPEVSIEVGIDDWVECRIKVTNPKEKLDNPFRAFTHTEGSHKIKYKEWEPTCHE